MYMCVYTYIYIYIYIYIERERDLHIYVYVYVCMHIYIYMCDEYCSMISTTVAPWCRRSLILMSILLMMILIYGFPTIQ